MNDRTGADDAAAAALLQKKHEEEHVALKDQLAGLEAQREQLASLLGGNPQGPLLQLQVCVVVFFRFRYCLIVLLLLCFVLNA